MMKPDRFFDNRVKGKIAAELVLDGENHPVAVPSEGRNNYKIRFRVVTENPSVQRVVYRLDSSYYDPVRESRDKENGFSVETTTYGDYSLLVDVQVGGETVRQQAMISDLLKESYKENPSTEIVEAIKEIEEN